MLLGFAQAVREGSEDTHTGKCNLLRTLMYLKVNFKKNIIIINMSTKNSNNMHVLLYRTKETRIENMEGIHHCSAKHCKNDSETNSDLQFFPFPSETDRYVFCRRILHVW
jgi:hypothetical protein